MTVWRYKDDRWVGIDQDTGAMSIQDVVGSRRRAESMQTRFDTVIAKIKELKVEIQGLRQLVDEHYDV